MHTRFISFKDIYIFTTFGVPAGSKDDLKRVILQQNKMKYNGIPIFQLPRETKIGSKNRRDMFQKSGVKSQYSIEERE